jgi:hypothetical protein
LNRNPRKLSTPTVHSGRIRPAQITSWAWLQIKTGVPGAHGGGVAAAAGPRHTSDEGEWRATLEQAGGVEVPIWAPGRGKAHRRGLLTVVRVDRRCLMAVGRRGGGGRQLTGKGGAGHRCEARRCSSRPGRWPDKEVHREAPGGERGNRLCLALRDGQRFTQHLRGGQRAAQLLRGVAGRISSAAAAA